MSKAKPGDLNISLSKGLILLKSIPIMTPRIFENYFNSEEILVSPNPVDDIVNILVGGNDQEVQFSIRDIRGVTLMSSIKKLDNGKLVLI